MTAGHTPASARKRAAAVPPAAEWRLAGKHRPGLILAGKVKVFADSIGQYSPERAIAIADLQRGGKIYDQQRATLILLCDSLRDVLEHERKAE